jgi:hypothetical protein
MSIHTVTTLQKTRNSDWNAFVDASPQGDVFCYSWWLDAITRSNFSVLVVLEDGEIVAGMPLPYDERKNINEPPLTRTLGVLYKPQNSLTDHIYTSQKRKWLCSLLEHLPRDNFVQMCMHHNFSDWLPFRWKGFNQTTRYTYLLDYTNRSEDDLWRQLNRGRKNIINRAIKNRIRVEETEDFELLYKFECLSYERQGLKFRIPFKVLNNLDEAIKKNGKRIIFKALDDSDRIHALIYLAFNNKSAYYLLSGSDPEHRKAGGHTLVLWEAVRFFRNKVDYFNFGGSDIQQIEEHIKGFGGVLTPYFHIFNEILLWQNSGIRQHSERIAFHLGAFTKSILVRLLKGRLRR